MPLLPEKLKIGPFSVKISRRKTGDGCWGDWRYADREIIVDDDLDPALTLSTFIHEVLHAIIDVFELADLFELAAVSGWDRCDEALISALEAGVFQVICDNAEEWRKLSWADAIKSARGGSM